MQTILFKNTSFDNLGINRFQVESLLIVLMWFSAGGGPSTAVVKGDPLFCALVLDPGCAEVVPGV